MNAIIQTTEVHYIVVYYSTFKNIKIIRSDIKLYRSWKLWRYELEFNTMHSSV